MPAIAGFVGGAYSAQNPVSANETAVNWFASAVETPSGATPAEMLPTPGLSTVATASVGGCRAAWAGDGRCFFVFGDTLFELDATLALTSRGTVALDGNPATISTNGDAGNQLLITSGGNAYSYDLGTDTLTLQITGNCLQGGVVDGFGVVFGAAQFRISDLFDVTVWDPTQFAQRSIQPDLWQAALIDPYGYITLLGSKTSESWSNVGASPFPFAPDRSGLMEEGIAAPFSVKQAGKQKVWLATNGNGGYQVMAAQGFTPRRISTHGLEVAIKGYAGIASAFADTYEDEGRAFYLLTFPQAGATWCYDFSTGLWHRRGFYSGGAFTYWRPAFHCFAFGRHLAGDLDSGAVLELRDDVHTDVGGVPIVRERQFFAGSTSNQLAFFDYLEIVGQSGVGLTSGAAEDVDPHVMLAISDDYGQTFHTERTTAIGAVGQREARWAWWGLGSGRGRYYRLRASAAVPVRLTAATQRVRMGAPLEAA
jgi:hypothetical protein